MTRDTDDVVRVHLEGAHEAARKCAEDMNRERLGLSPKDAAHIVTTSMSIKEEKVS